MLCDEKLGKTEELEEKLKAAMLKVQGSFAEEEEEQRLDDLAKRMRIENTDYQDAKERRDLWRISYRNKEARYAMPHITHTVRCFMPFDIYNNGHFTEADFYKYMWHDTTQNSYNFYIPHICVDYTTHKLCRPELS